MVTDPKLSIMQLLRDEWNPANTSSITPTFRAGWPNVESTYPLLTVTGATEGPLGGGDTGYTGMDPGGAGPTQIRTGTVDANVWIREDVAGVDPQALLWQMCEEVERIVRQQYDTIPDLNFIGLGERRDQTDDDRQPLIFRMLNEVLYSYDKRP